MNWVTRYYNYLKTWRLHRETIKQLNTMSDAALKDIGINRGDINRMIWLDEDMIQRGTKNEK
tara:strand:+ start:1056 stop:1241 length:186 start_codon:yes stop_codon:yes gene_type:complete